MGGTWFWNRYPGARFDSESYTYGYLFSSELFDEWEWQEHFAGQPEIERYLNHVVDRFDLRRHMRFGAPVTSAVWDERVGDVGGHDRRRDRRRAARFLVAATGVLSVPYVPDVPGRDDFARRAAPHRPLAGRRRWTSPASGSPSSARRRAACRSSPSIVDEVADAHRVPALGQLVHAAQQPADHRRGAGAAAGRLRAAPRGAQHLDPRLPPPA